MLGTFRVTVFMISGILINLIGGIAFYFVTKLVFASAGIRVLTAAGIVGAFSPNLSTYYLILSILMEIAILYPEGVVRFWFILPMKMKWMLYLTLAELAYEVGRVFFLVIRTFGATTA